MRFYELEPEVAGGLGKETILDTSTHPPIVSVLHYEFGGWDGDALLASFPCLIVTKPLGEKLGAEGYTGFSLSSVLVTESLEFQQLQPDACLPEFLWLKPDGKRGVDDVALSPDCLLVVSEPVLELLREYGLEHCEVNEYRG